MTDKSHLSDMNAKERDLLISLPYRVGIWMSHSDDEAGEKDDSRERTALASSIEGYAKASGKTPLFIREICQAMIGKRDYWPEWEATALDILADCERAADILRDKTDSQARKHYKRLLIVIASRIAGAYGEFGGMEDEENFADRAMNAVKALLGGAKPDSGFANISPAEQAALQRLKTALHFDEDE